MSSGCISSASTLGCIDAQGPVRATYRNIYKWPESDAEFVKSVTRGGGWCEQQQRRGPRRQFQQPRVVDSYSCRQMYLRSYTFSKKESVPERTKKCLGRVKERVAAVAANGKRVPGCVPLWVNGGTGKGGDEGVGMASAGSSGEQRRKKRCPGVRRLRDASSAAFCSIFHRLLSCTTSVEVVDR
ncbi:hypothetical protein Taro_034620 [Colocasia esculenta]|uniref:Uncharacterized protein n=1 Tax=Colocasia esculenta TaxID=4460 RepID=A0A843W853_COLES|nr:hypothetical protein [Colocasia esculenta]